MDPATIALIFQALDLAIQLAPEVVQLVEQIKAAIAKNADVMPSLKAITDGTIQVSDATLEPERGVAMNRPTIVLVLVLAGLGACTGNAAVVTMAASAITGLFGYLQVNRAC